LTQADITNCSEFFLLVVLSRLRTITGKNAVNHYIVYAKIVKNPTVLIFTCLGILDSISGFDCRQHEVFSNSQE